MGRENFDKKDIVEVNQSYEEINARLKALLAKSVGHADEIERVDADVDRIAQALEGASSEEKDALLFEAQELSRKRDGLVGELRSSLTEAEGLREDSSALRKRSPLALEELRTASLETEKMFFEVYKLVATLAVGSIVAISAVTPALFPQLGNLEGLWPAYGCLLFSLASAVVACAYLALSIGMTLNPKRPRGKGWLSRRLPEKADRLISAITYAAVLALPLSSLLIGLWWFVTFVGAGLD